MMAALLRMGRPATENMTVMGGKEDDWQERLTRFKARKWFDALVPAA